MLFLPITLLFLPLPLLASGIGTLFRRTFELVSGHRLYRRNAYSAYYYEEH